jgi:PAS domain S-box-containing protein
MDLFANQGNNGSNRLGRGAPRRIALIYALVAGAWIFLSDTLLVFIHPEWTIRDLTWLQTSKGLVFVIATAVMLYVLVRQAMQQIGESHKALQESQDHFRRMVELSPNGVFVQFDGKFAYANQAMLNILSITDPNQLLGRSILDFIHPDYHSIAKERMRILREERKVVPLLEERMRRTDGTYVWVEITARPFDAQGRAGAQVIVRDISGRKQAEAEVRDLTETLERRVMCRTAELQQANEDLRTFSYTISHDLRTPLRSMTGFAESMLQLETVRHDPAAEEYARRMIAAVARLDRLIEDLFEYNQLARQESRPQRVSLVLVVHDVIGQLGRVPEFADADITIREPMPWVLVHRPTLSLVIQNLLHNALKFVAPGIKPTIVVRSEDRSDRARLIIEDNGVGIDPARAASIFHLFEQPHESDATGGSGIGLAIVRRGVERMGGKAGVEPNSGGGSRFWIELPRDPQSP